MSKPRPITFPKTPDGHWTNSETGVRIERYGKGYRPFRPAWDDEEHRIVRIGIKVEQRTLANARFYAEQYVRNAYRSQIARAYDEALAEHIERAADATRDAGPAAERCINVARDNFVHHLSVPNARAWIINCVADAENWAEQKRRKGLCTAKVNGDYPHTYEVDVKVSIDLTVKPGWDTCGKTEAAHADYTPERIRSANWRQAIYQRAASNALPPKSIPMNMSAAYRELVDEAHAEAERLNRAIDLDVRGYERGLSDVVSAVDLGETDHDRAVRSIVRWQEVASQPLASRDLCLRADGAHFMHMSAREPSCREVTDEERQEFMTGCTFVGEGWADDHPYEYDLAVVEQRRQHDDGRIRCGAHREDDRHTVAAIDKALAEVDLAATDVAAGVRMYVEARYSLTDKGVATLAIEGAKAPADADRTTGLPPAPDVNDDAAWATYCSMLPTPTTGELAAVAVEFYEPYAEEIAASKETFVLAARTIWRGRIDGSVKPGSDAYRRMREVMATCRLGIQIYRQLGEAWAHRALAETN